MPTIILDTNILIRDPLFKKAHATTLVEGCKVCNYRIFIPEVVIDELVGNCSKEIINQNAAIKKARNELAIWGIENQLAEIDLKSAIKNFIEQLKKTLRDNFIDVEPYPEVSAKDLVTASYKNKKPFKDTGEGYKDYLIFQTVLDLLDETKDEIYFITNNHKDFCNKNKKLHPDLAELIPEEYKHLPITVYSSLHDFNAEILTPQFESLVKISAEIQEGTFEGFDLEEQLSTLIHEELTNDRYSIDVNIPLDEPTVYSIQDYKVEHINVSRMTDNLLVFDLQGQIDLELFGFLNKNDHWHINEGKAEGIHIDDANWNDYVMSATMMATAQFEMAVVFNEDKKTVESVSIDVCLADPDF